nr:hypothetical transcript [Hymenolepis microstoma]
MKRNETLRYLGFALGPRLGPDFNCCPQLKADQYNRISMLCLDTDRSIKRIFRYGFKMSQRQPVENPTLKIRHRRIHTPVFPHSATQASRSGIQNNDTEPPLTRENYCENEANVSINEDKNTKSNRGVMASENSRFHDEVVYSPSQINYKKSLKIMVILGFSSRLSAHPPSVPSFLHPIPDWGYARKKGLYPFGGVKYSLVSN